MNCLDTLVAGGNTREIMAHLAALVPEYQPAGGLRVPVHADGQAAVPGGVVERMA